MLRGGFLAFAFLLGCSPSSGEIGAPSGSNSGGTGGTDPGVGGESGAPSEPNGGTGGGTAGSGGSPDLCQAGDERTCSCAPGYGGKQTCSDFGWNLCSCPGWPPAGGAGGTGGTGGSASELPALGDDCTIGGDECVEMDAAFPACMPADGMAGGEQGRPGRCSWACMVNGSPSQAAITACTEQGGQCMPVGTLISHCVAW